MVVIFDKKKFTFEEKWTSTDGSDVSDILSNFLSERAISDGADPAVFAGIKTATKTRITKGKKLEKLSPVKNNLKSAGIEILFKIE